jgi:hypothetical protein
MKVTGILGRAGLIALLAGLLAPAAVPLHAQSPQGQAVVRGLAGSAVYSMAGSAETPLRAGTILPIGSTIRTGPGSAVDLAFGATAGVVRLLQNSMLSLEKFDVPDPRPGAPIELRLNLLEGTMAGFGQKAASNSKYRVKVSRGIADVGGTKYRISAEGYLVVLEGTALFAFVPASGEPVPFELRAPSPVYFSPVEGVRPAPAELEREVLFQTKGQLKGKR